ncbi:MAG: cysteine hydrolase [Alphaproteobacteria bacterium]|nr:cysteine hydrolase [Alphaproteobacteria bacterium]
MSEPKTLMEMAGADRTPVRFEDGVLVLIDIQNEYLDGPLALPGAAPAVEKAAEVLAKARSAGTPVVHIAHKGKAGSLFDRDAACGQIVDALAPREGERVIEKGLPNAFAGTDLKDAIDATGRTEVIFAGFMSHMCVSSTARAALDLGYRSTVVRDACATRDLPDGEGGSVPADQLHKAAMVALSDRFAVIAPAAAWE